MSASDESSTNVLPHVRDSLLVRAARLTVVRGPDAGLERRFASPNLIVGSGETAGLRLRDESVSREHLRLELSGYGVRVRDPSSRNGTWMGATRVHDAMLTEDTHLSLGETILSVALEAESTELPLSAGQTFGRAVGHSPAMRHVFATLEAASQSDATVLIEGESGAGKELLACGVHEHSPRAHGPFVAVDCGAIPPSLIESELFGHERGAFTGAERARDGLFVQAHGGTIFLDELGELPIDMQPKLLRVLETRQVRPVGGNRVRDIDVRIVAATNRNLADAAQRNTFRRDLYYRVAVVRVFVPPLRDRVEDILPLAQWFMERAADYKGQTISRDLASMLTAYTWPGNVRELRNVIQRYLVLGANPVALFDGRFGDLHSAPAAASLADLAYHEARKVALDRFERTYLPEVLARHDGNVSRAAVSMGIGRGSLHRMLLRIRDDAAGGPGEDP
jgi:transcriptional regulator with PAS, ATPase and Fis domain